jgi:hypothetical protein
MLIIIIMNNIFFITRTFDLLDDLDNLRSSSTKYYNVRTRGFTVNEIY